MKTNANSLNIHLGPFRYNSFNLNHLNHITYLHTITDMHVFALENERKERNQQHVLLFEQNQPNPSTIKATETWDAGATVLSQRRAEGCAMAEPPKGGRAT